MRNAFNRKIKFFKIYTMIIAIIGLVGCGGSSNNPIKNESIQSSMAAYDRISTDSFGVIVGPPSMSNPVYVLFDPQCPHCTTLWEAALPLQNKIKFIWIPVAILGNKSKEQGIAILSAPNPMSALASHELSMKDNLGGILIPTTISADFELKVRKNTELINFLGLNSVPIVVAKHQKTGREVIQVGSMSTSELLVLIGAN